MRIPTPIAASLLLAAFTIFLILRQPSQLPLSPTQKESSAGTPQPLAPTKTASPLDKLSLLGEIPDWRELEPYQYTMARGDFEHLLQNVFTTDSSWQLFITIHEDSAEIVTSSNPDEPPFILNFATEEIKRPSPRNWKTTAGRSAPSPEKPLTDLHIAIDPGHIGGEWAKIEGRWFQIGQDKPVTEGDMTLHVAHLLKPLLESYGARVSLVRSTTDPVTPYRPENFTALAENDDSLSDPESLRLFTEKLFYRTSEIRARATLVNELIKPDLVICLHFNADAWGDPKNPTLVPNNHFHILLNGAYTAEEIQLPDQRFVLLKKLLQSTHDEELIVSKTIAETFAKITQLPPYVYHPSGKNFRAIDGSEYLYARNLLANRLYDCPVIFMEPYVMNSVADYNRIQAGDYPGLREINGQFLPSIFQEYAHALAAGLVKHYGKTP